MDQQICDDWYRRVYDAYKVEPYQKDALTDAIDTVAPPLSVAPGPMRRPVIEAVVAGIPRAAVAGKLTGSMSTTEAVPAILVHTELPKVAAVPHGEGAEDGFKQTLIPLATMLWDTITRAADPPVS